MKAAEANSIAQKKLDSVTIDHYLPKIYTLIERAAKEGQFTLTICEADLPGLSDIEIRKLARALKIKGYRVNLADELKIRW